MTHALLPRLSRRGLMGLGLTGAAALAAPSLLSAQTIDLDTYATAERKRHNTASFRSQRWQDHFQNLNKGAILCDLESRALHFWSQDGSLHLTYPSSVPMNEELTMRGYTTVTLKRRNPTWIPTPDMLKRDPSLPAQGVPPGPSNPLGSRALNLGWQYYRIHGIDKVEKIGRPASNGCVGLYNRFAERLFDLVVVGTQVRFL